MGLQIIINGSPCSPPHPATVNVKPPSSLFLLMVISVIILSKPKMFNSFNQLLITLSALDSVFIVLALYDYSWVR